jgi:hypothetical protein
MLRPNSLLTFGSSLATVQPRKWKFEEVARSTAVPPYPSISPTAFGPPSVLVPDATDSHAVVPSLAFVHTLFVHSEAAVLNQLAARVNTRL